MITFTVTSAQIAASGHVLGARAALPLAPAEGTVSVKEAAQALSVSQSTVHRRIDAGGLLAFYDPKARQMRVWLPV